MNTNFTRMSVLLLLTVAYPAASGQRRGVRTCSCQAGSGPSQRGKLVGSVCYVVGVGACRSFTYEGSSQLPSRRRLPLSSRLQSRSDTALPGQLSSSSRSQFSSSHQDQYSAYLQRQREAARPGGRLLSGGSRRDNLRAAAATASPEQRRSAFEAVRRQLEARRTYERELVTAGVTVRPGSPEAALASERRPDDKSAALGNKALAQILYLQSLLGRSGRR